MKRFDVTFSREADADFDAIIDFIARNNPIRAVRFVDELQQKAVETLSQTPYAGRREGDYRVLVLANYVAVYRVDGERRSVRVMMVSEGHRDWRALAMTRR